MQILKAGSLYFAMVFGIGFVLGTIRTLWIIPRIGTRRAELMEAPIMLIVTILIARWAVLHLAIPPILSARLGMGCIALALMLVAEFGFVTWIRSLSLRDYLAMRDRLSGMVYYTLLLIFALLPLFVAR